jgi:hypothetical protein
MAPVQLETRRVRLTRPESSSIKAKAPNTAVSTRSVPTAYLFSACAAVSGVSLPSSAFFKTSTFTPGESSTFA